MGDHLEDRLTLLVGESQPRPDQLVQAFILQRSGGSIGETLAGIARNRLCPYRGVAVVARSQRECRGFESLQPLFR